jgi:hypothetical protein
MKKIVLLIGFAILAIILILGIVLFPKTKSILQNVTNNITDTESKESKTIRFYVVKGTDENAILRFIEASKKVSGVTGASYLTESAVEEKYQKDNITYTPEDITAIIEISVERAWMRNDVANSLSSDEIINAYDMPR